ncbi:soluble quino protein glucose dehydrogenase [Coprinopsis marcescibilis]|uniref:Soluble quino protein glucose dehydrogenase n=1 Tax=Coprinopsis marcescibilis TaxID=230819 RepID=A0A5C3L5C6_COPMA|nr:soluble quino protein glucose dehydrogenase [Coprinopsis marcescibilis]
MVSRVACALAFILPVLVKANPAPQRPPPPSNTVVCARAPAPSFPVSVASGFRAGPVLGGLTIPRGLTLDSRGNLLIVERGKGVTGHTVDNNGCVTRSRVVIADTDLNHGIGLSEDGTKLFASSSTTVWSWDYNPRTLTATNRRTIVRGISAEAHRTRTLVLSKENPNFLVVSVGANENVDRASIDPAVGRSQIRSFDLRRIPNGGAVFNGPQGRVLGFGIRNGVGVAEDQRGVVHTIDNSLDNAFRVVGGVQIDVHNDNPAEGIFRLGRASNPSNVFAGAPFCYPVWDPSLITDSNMRIGDVFSIEPESEFNDGFCAANAQRPAALLPPHTSPLDITFGVNSDSSLYVTLHGSFNRAPAQGYKVVRVPGRYTRDGWVPTADPRSNSSFTNFLTNTRDEGLCEEGCFRPASLVWSPNGRHLYVSSDTTGEVFLARRV